MLNLKLRDEFMGPQMPGTAIALRRKDDSGAVQQGPEYILSLTYPTADVQTALRALSVNRPRCPIVLMGDRGRGKSHIMAVMHHAMGSPEYVEQWAKEWGNKLPSKILKELTLERNFVPISEPVQNQEYRLLWDLIFDRHPRGDFFKGKFEQSGYPYPPRSLLEEMFEAQPVALILDEFQKWFDGLSDQPGAEGVKFRTLAENFIQNLSEISKDRPEILILVISVLNNSTEAFRQVHRVAPVLIDFHGPTARQDRQRLLLYRLFQNRGNIPQEEMGKVASAYAAERFRLRFSHLSEAEKIQKTLEVIECWPFSPELIGLLEDHILMSEAAQETRDLIRILASVFRARGDNIPVITPADFFVDDNACGVQSLLDSIVTVGEQERLRQIAQRNLEEVRKSGEAMPHARELISAIWLRSLTPGRNCGGTRQELHLDITREQPVDDNFFQSEMVQLIETSINIHGEETPEGRLFFGPGENPRTKVRAFAKNDGLWQSGAIPSAGQIVYPGQDIAHIRKTLTHILVPETKQPASQVVVLGPKWKEDPWSEVEDTDKPPRWDRPVLIVIPEILPLKNSHRLEGLGRWLKDHTPKRRNTVRFLLPAEDSKGIFTDNDLRFMARCSYLTSIAWKDDRKYLSLKDEFDEPLRKALRKRFDRFAVLRRWDFPNPDHCTFDIERLGVQGSDIPATVEQKLKTDIFDPAEFQKLVLERAKESGLIGDLLDELYEPPPNSTQDAIPFLGDTPTHEEVLKIVAKGKVVVNVGGSWVGRLPNHSEDEEALRYVQSKAFKTGQEMRQIRLGLPSAAGGATVPGPSPQPPVTPPQPPGGGWPQPLPFPPQPPGVEEPPDTTTQPPGGAAPTPTPIPTTPGAKPVTSRSTEEPNTGINLSGCFEKWGITPDTTLDTAKIEFSNLTAQQIKQVLQRLPSSLKASLDVTFTEEED
jgi:hypothetical protein